MTALERLLSIVPPPGRMTALAFDWDAILASVGPLPADYVAFGEVYGACTFDNFLTLFAPQSKSENVDLFEQAKLQLWALREVAPAWAWGPGRVPFDLGQDMGGELLPWGVTSNGDLCFWVRRSLNPDDWTVAVYESRGPDWFQYAGNITDFLAGVLSGQETCEIFVEDFPSSPHSCVAH